jgi:hypothetical protein
MKELLTEFLRTILSEKKATKDTGNPTAGLTLNLPDKKPPEAKFSRGGKWYGDEKYTDYIGRMYQGKWIPATAAEKEQEKNGIELVDKGQLAEPDDAWDRLTHQMQHGTGHIPMLGKTPSTSAKKQARGQKAKPAEKPTDTSSGGKTSGLFTTVIKRDEGKFEAAVTGILDEDPESAKTSADDLKKLFAARDPNKYGKDAEPFVETSPAQLTSTLESTRDDAFSGRNPGKGGASTTAQEELSALIFEVALEIPDASKEEVIQEVRKRLEVHRERAGKAWQLPEDEKQLRRLINASSAGVEIASDFRNNPRAEFNPNQPAGYPRVCALSSRASNAILDTLITQYKEAKTDEEREHALREIEKFRKHATASTGREGDGDTAVMYHDTEGKIRVHYVTNKQSTADPKANTTRMARGIAIVTAAEQVAPELLKVGKSGKAPIEALQLVQNAVSKEVQNINTAATSAIRSMVEEGSSEVEQSIKDLCEDDMASRLISSTFGRSMYEPAGDKYRSNAVKNKAVQEKMGENTDDCSLVRAALEATGTEGATQISDNASGSPGKLLMKMSEVWSRIDAHIQANGGECTSDVAEDLLSKRDPKTRKTPFAGTLKVEDVCRIHTNVVLKRISELREERGDSMSKAHEDLVKNMERLDRGKQGENGENGPFTRVYVETWMRSMHWHRYISGEEDADISASVGSFHVKSRYYQACLRELTEFKGEDSEFISYLQNYLRIRPGSGTVEFVSQQTRKTVVLGEDTWRTGGDGEKITGTDGKDLQNCLLEKAKKDQA